MIMFASDFAEFVQDLPTFAVLGIAWAAYALLGTFYLQGIRRVRLFA